MATFYIVDMGNGHTRGIAVPTFSGNRLTDRYERWYNSATDLYNYWAGNVDLGATYFVKTATHKEYMNQIGFADVIDCSQHIGERWTFSNGNYITFSSNTGATIWYNNGNANSSYPGSGTPVSTMLSDCAMNNWLNGVVGYCTYFIGLRSTISDGIQVQTDTIVTRNELNQASFDIFWAGLEPYEPPTDPYEEGGDSGEGGGDGTFSEEGEDVEIPELPELTAVSTGFIKLYHPSLSQLNSLSTYMWGANFDITLFKRLFADPMDCILGLSIVPVSVPSGSTETVNIGNISTGISMPRAGSQYVTVDCGSVNVAEFWGSFLDYEPYTKAEIYLPYIGTHPISVDDIMGKTVSVVYHVDILSGACVAYISCGGTVLYNFIGHCSSSIPVTSRDWTNVINGVMNIAGAIGTMVATGGASAPMQIPGMAANAVNAIKPNIEKSGAMGGTGGLMAVQKPYLILTRPRQAHPAQQWKYTGYPSFITSSLDNIGGYTEIEAIHLENINALDEELTEIERLLKEGVIF